MDKYDEEVERLTDNPADIYHTWLSGELLFKYASPSNEDFTPQNAPCGCLTMIRSDSESWHAWTPELTDAIRADERLPQKPTQIKVEHLPIFAEWQRRIDKELGRV